MAAFLILLVRVYQAALSPHMGRACRFSPTCSEFMIGALRARGIRGLPAGLRRVCRCHPLNPGGYDPVENWIRP